MNEGQELIKRSYDLGKLFEVVKSRHCNLHFSKTVQGNVIENNDGEGRGQGTRVEQLWNHPGPVTHEREQEIVNSS